MSVGTNNLDQYLFGLKNGVAAVYNNTPNYAGLVARKYEYDFQFETYLVDVRTYQPIGYLSWGFEVLAMPGGYSVQHAKADHLDWHLGSSPNWSPIGK